MAPVDTDAHFFGRVSASYTHEIKNVLATINEAGGLMQDILSLEPEKRAGFLDKLPRSLGVVQEQIERGQHLTSQFNAFVHAADHDPANFDLQDTLEMMVDLTQRLARRNMVELQVESGVQTWLAVTPVVFLKLLFSSIMWSVSQSEKNSTVVLGAEGQGDSVVISIRVPALQGGKPQSREAWDEIEGQARVLQSQVRWDGDQGRLLLSLPARSS